jgi:glycerol-3-phosphate dehydrogenase
MPSPSKATEDPTVYDLVVVGAGIYGVWAAYHAQQRGLKVLLIEKGDIGAQTSSCSTKLLHGGLRYLENLEFKLVRKSLKERAKLSQLFPHLFHAAEFIIPIINNQPAPLWKMRCGLWLYDHLSLSKSPVIRSSRLSPEESHLWSSQLKPTNIQAFMSYGDGITDDHRLTLSVAFSFVQLGGKILTYTRATPPPQKGSGGVVVVRTENEQGAQCEVQSRYVLHCSGTALTDPSYQTEPARISKGVHLILPKLPIDKALLLKSPLDGRVFFIVPWYGRSMLGTTDTVESVEQKPTVQAVDVDYLLHSLNHYFKFNYTQKDILGAFAGHRVLAGESTDSPSKQSRDWKMSEMSPHQSCSLGGKFTSARIDALEIIERRYGSALSVKQELLWGTCTPPEKMILFEKFQACQLSKDIFDHLFFRYGQHLSEVIKILQENESAKLKIHEDLNFIWAEISYCARHEYITHLSDLLRRRLPLMLLIKYDEKILETTLEICSTIKNWDSQKAREEFNQASQDWKTHSLFS